MRTALCLALGLMPIVGRAWAQEPTAPPRQGTTTAGDPILESLIHEAIDRNPDLAKSKALVEADKERIPQSKALPDPTLSLGLQNDGFKKLQVGEMENSYYQIMLTQPLPWPGKRDLRGKIAGLGADISKISAERTRLSLEADVKRAYFGLLLVRGQLQLLEDQALFLEKAQAITQARYEVGQGSQADLLRAQLERNRLNQTRLVLQVEEGTLISALNRLRGITEATPIPTAASIENLQVEEIPVDALLARAEAKSPELQSAKLGIRQAERSLDLAKLDRRPDFAVSAGVMPRGSLEPMWQVGFSISLPVWSRQKQQRAVAEQEWRRKSQGSEATSVQNLLSQRVRERAAQMTGTLGALRIYRDGLLIQSQASFQATLAQYESGRAPFLSVLETLNGWVADRGGLLQAVAQAKAIEIAQEEFNLGVTPPISAQGLGASAMGMGGSPASSGASRPTSSKSGGSPAQGESGAMKAM
jgi:cobalt-zinc-cadmium efflux system outer membrane protein